jgi:hypothetical protein
LHAPLDATPIALRVPATIKGLIRNFGESHTASSSVLQLFQRKKEKPVHVNSYTPISHFRMHLLCMSRQSA